MHSITWHSSIRGPLLAALFATWLAAATPAQAVLVDELCELYPDSSLEVGSAGLRVDTARGVPAGVTVLLRGLAADSELACEVHLGGQPVSAARWYRLVAVPVEENTGLTSRTERWDGRRNPHVIRRAPFRIFEALEPITSPLRVAGEVCALRLEIPIAAEARVGQRHFEIRITPENRDGLTLRFDVAVHRPVVPPPGRDTLTYTNWFSPSNIARHHGCELWSEEFWSLLARYGALMARGRQNTFWLRWPDFFAREAQGYRRLDRPRLVRYVETFSAAGLHWIEGAPIAGRPGGDWSSKRLEIGMVGELATSREGRRALADMAQQLMAAIRAEGWQERWLQHLADEPTDTNASDYCELSRNVRELMPDIPIVEATMSRELVDAIDIWCPQVQNYQEHREFFEQRRAAGDRIWVYTCLVPGGPWLNRLLDMERLRQTYIGWAAAHYDLHGFLHWGLNHYRADPFAQSVVLHGKDPGGKNRLPAGDSHIVYPGPDGPWSSQRFEAHRIGLEDCELLRMLRARDPARCTQLIRQLFRAFDDYTAEVASYRRVKAELLEALDERGGSHRRP